jgi:hypothetical protein
MKTEFYRLSDESVHIFRLAGKDLCLLKSDLVIMVDTVRPLLIYLDETGECAIDVLLLSSE